MSITKRLRFIAKSYLNDLIDDDITGKAKKGLEGLFGGSGEAQDDLGDIDLEELDRKFQEEFGEYTFRTKGKKKAKRRSKPSRARSSDLSKHYAILELPPGSDYEACRKQFRALMRKYHPDRYAADPKKQKWATDKSQGISESFAALEKALKK